MFSKKAKLLTATAVLTALGVAVTGVASARINVASINAASTAQFATVVPGHDHAGGGHLDAAATALGMTVAELQSALVAGTSLADVAASKGVAVEKVIDALVAEATTKISQHVTDGNLTQARADEMLAQLTDRVTAMVNADVSAFGHRGGGFGGPGHGLPGLHNSTVLEDILDLTSEEIRTGLSDGKSIADLAKEQGVDVQKVIDALVAEAKAKISQHVTDGNLTQARADEMLALLTDRVTAMVNGDVPAFGHRGGGFGGPGHGMGQNGHGMGRGLGMMSRVSA